MKKYVLSAPNAIASRVHFDSDIHDSAPSQRSQDEIDAGLVICDEKDIPDWAKEDTNFWNKDWTPFTEILPLWKKRIIEAYCCGYLQHYETSERDQKRFDKKYPKGLNIFFKWDDSNNISKLSVYIQDLKQALDTEEPKDLKKYEEAGSGAIESSKKSPAPPPAVYEKVFVSDPPGPTKPPPPPTNKPKHSHLF